MNGWIFLCVSLAYHTTTNMVYFCGYEIQMWIAKAEYDESGPSIVHRKCF